MFMPFMQIHDCGSGISFSFCFRYQRDLRCLFVWCFLERQLLSHVHLTMLMISFQGCWWAYFFYCLTNNLGFLNHFSAGIHQLNMFSILASIVVLIYSYASWYHWCAFSFFDQTFKCPWGCSYSMGNWASRFWNAQGTSEIHYLNSRHLL